MAAAFFRNLEREAYLAFLRLLNLGEEQLTRLAVRVHSDLDGVLAQLRSVEDAQSREAMGRCFDLIAASDGALRPAEKQILAQLLEAIGQSQQLEQAEELCAHFRKEEGALGQAMGAVSNASDAVGSALGWMKDKLRNQQKPNAHLQDDDFKADTGELRAQQLLQKMAELDHQLATGEVNAEAYRAQWADLKAQVPSRVQFIGPIASTSS
jgi:hypothetical protein